MEETNRKVRELERELLLTEQQLSLERDMVAKQQATIRVQSEAISMATPGRPRHSHPSSEPRPVSPPQFGLPTRGRPSHPVAAPLPRPENMSTPSRPLQHPESMSTASRPFRHPEHMSAPPRPLPRPENVSTPSRQRFSAPRHGYSAPRTPDPATIHGGAFAHTSPRSLVPETPTRAGHGSTSVGMEEATPDHRFEITIQKLFSMAERFAYAHMNFPSSAKDSQLPGGIKDRLMSAATRESAHQLASTGATRYFLMTKVVIQWIVKHICKLSLFKGFDSDADRRITGYKDQIYPDTPKIVKHQLLSEISKEIRQIRAIPDFQRKLDDLVKIQAPKLWAIVKPLMHHNTAMDWEDLNTLMYEAYSVAGDMAAAPYEWRFDFAPIGSPYHTSMVNRDPYIHGHEDDLATRNLVVKLGLSPAVHLRDNTGGFSRIAQVVRHQVLVKGQ